MIPPGVTAASIAVAVRGDTVNEPDETFTVWLWFSRNLDMPVSSALGTILNDDAVPGRVDHFVFRSVPSPQLAAAPFPVTVTAVDAFEATVTDFTGAVALSAAAQPGKPDAVVVPNSLSNFAAGVWSGPVTLSPTNRGVVLQVDDGQEHIGASNLPRNLPFKPVGTYSTASLNSPEKMGTRWNASLPGSGAVRTSARTRRLLRSRHADFSPQGPRTDARAWSFRGRQTFPRSCGLKSACRVRFMAGERVRMEQAAS